MEILEDIYQEQKNQKEELKILRAAIVELKTQVNKPSNVHLDSEKLAKLLTPNIDTSLKALENKTEELKILISKIPKEINSRKEWGIDLYTKAWLLIVFVSLLSGFWLAPKVVEKAEYKATKYQLEHLEQQVQEFKTKNPILGDKYFGF